MSPTQRSLKLLRSNGYLCQITERWCSFSKRRIDLFGFIDIVAVRGNETLAVQTTSGSNVSARIAKILANPNADLWRSETRKIQVHGWSKLGKAGTRKTWQCRIESL